MITGLAKVTVRFAETDAMGVVYHANYLPWFECARLDLISNVGLSYEKLIDEGYHLPVVEAHVNYKYPARFNDSVEIRAAIKERPTVKMKVEYEARCGGKLLVSGHTVHVFVDTAGRPVKPPKEWAQKLSKNFGKC